VSSFLVSHFYLSFIFTHFARSLLGGREELSVPRLFFIEVASALAKR
jgi:hypothetical protein